MAHIALVYEITENPLFGAQKQQEDRLTEFPQPTEINEISEMLRDSGHTIKIVDGPVELALRAESIKAECDLVFNKSVGVKGLERKIHVPSICLLHGIPLVGSSAYPMTLARHKYHTNRLLAGLGYPVPKAVIYNDLGDPAISTLKFPVIVKPNHESDALGIDSDSVVTRPTDAVERAKSLLDRFSQPAVIEEFIPGEEWKIPVVGNPPNVRALGCVSVHRDGRPIVGSLQTRRDVVSGGVNYVRIEGDPCSAAMRMSERIHADLGLVDYSRCDFRLDTDGDIRCMEISTHPELSRGSSFMLAAGGEGHESDVMQCIISAAEERTCISRSRTE